MQVFIKHSLPGRIRLGYKKDAYTSKQALLAQTLIAVQDGVINTDCNPLTCSFLIYYDTQKISEKEILNLFKALGPKYLNDKELLKTVETIPERESLSGVLIQTAALYFLKRLILPLQVRRILSYKNLVKRWLYALSNFADTKKFFTTDLLDATAVTVAIATGNYNTATQINTLLNMGEDVEEITKRQSYGNLAQTLMINNETTHLLVGDEEKSVPASSLHKGDKIIVRRGDVIPCDGEVVSGEGMVNQATITGESLPVTKTKGKSAFAGTLVEEGELVIVVREAGKNTKVQNIIDMIDNSQNLKAQAQKRSEQFADKVVPFNFLLAGLTWLFTRNTVKTMSTLMVDYSCAMKLSAPISVLSALKEGASKGITIKGGKYLEEASFADTVIFDKTGTLTYATPVLATIYPLENYTEREVLTWAACLEEHYPHPLGRAVVKEAENRNLIHPETHTKVEYIVAHGIASTIDDKKIRIGSAHFIFEDEKIPCPKELEKIREKEADLGNSLLYLAYDGKLAGIISIGDPARPGTKEIIEKLHKLGISRCVMITGDTEGAAKKIATESGLDFWLSQALPEDKVNFIIQEKKKGHKVIMLGDGINDAPALSEANVGIAVDGCSAIAGETADIQLQKNGLENLVTVRELGTGLMERIYSNNQVIIGVNSALMLAGIFGFISPQIAAILHNSTTIAISIKSMQPILPE